MTAEGNALQEEHAKLQKQKEVFFLKSDQFIFKCSAVSFICIVKGSSYTLHACRHGSFAPARLGVLQKATSAARPFAIRVIFRAFRNKDAPIRRLYNTLKSYMMEEHRKKRWHNRLAGSSDSRLNKGEWENAGNRLRG